MNRTTEKSELPEASDFNHATYGEGCGHYNQGNFSKAKQSFITALEYWPEDPQAWFALGNCYDELNKPKKAEECFRKALQFTSSEKQSDAMFNLGNSLFDQNKFAEAAKYYASVSAQSKEYWAAQRNLELANEALSNQNT